jgi:hypothetical protein
VIVVTEPEFLEWRQHRVTQAFFKACFNDRETLKEMLLAGTDDDNGIRGRAAALGLILGMTYEDLMESVRENRE